MTSESFVPQPQQALSTPKAPGTRTRNWMSWTIAIVFAFFYAADVFEGLSNLVTIGGAVGSSLPAGAWVVLGASVGVPLIVYGSALWITRRQKALATILIFLIGLAVSATWALSLESLFRFFLPGF